MRPRGPRGIVAKGLRSPKQAGRNFVNPIGQVTLTHFAHGQSLLISLIPQTAPEVEESSSHTALSLAEHRVRPRLGL